jgi:hypothetical protein
VRIDVALAVREDDSDFPAAIHHHVRDLGCMHCRRGPLALRAPLLCPLPNRQPDPESFHHFGRWPRHSHAPVRVADLGIVHLIGGRLVGGLASRACRGTAVDNPDDHAVIGCDRIRGIDRSPSALFKACPEISQRRTRELSDSA